MVSKEHISKRNKILKGLKLAHDRMIEFKRYKNSKVVVSQNGKIVHLDPFTIEIPKDREKK
ncbi:MAG: hypothetical protein RJQ09_00515 [Cyclobacteriaceae bacterium]